MREESILLSVNHISPDIKNSAMRIVLFNKNVNDFKDEGLFQDEIEGKKLLIERERLKILFTKKYSECNIDNVLTRFDEKEHRGKVDVPLVCEQLMLKEVQNG